MAGVLGLIGYCRLAIHIGEKNENSDSGREHSIKMPEETLVQLKKMIED
jgi:hypothetical protein